MSKRFTLHTPFPLAGDQPLAVRALTQHFQDGMQFQTLMGVTGSGKTLTMAALIEHLNLPTLVLSPNKTLAAQLYREFKEFFPENAVEYFVSYYDYYQPESYVPSKDLYISKESEINDEIDRMRVSAVTALIDRPDALVVASVSCIYGLGSPSEYEKMRKFLKVGMQISRQELIQHLIYVQYERKDFDLKRASFRVRGDIIDVHLAYSKELIRIQFFGDEIDKLQRLHFLTGQVFEELERIIIYPAKIFLPNEDKLERALTSITAEMEHCVQEFKDLGKPVEAHRLETRTRYDMEMLVEMGYCSGIENYTRHLSGSAPGEMPATLMHFYRGDFLTIIDESHIAVPQVGGMFAGNKSRKQSLIDFGFRLPSAQDNRPLNYPEFESLLKKTVFVSATPSEYEIQKSSAIVEQVIRPTGLLDPVVSVRPSAGQIENIATEVKIRKTRGERVLITTLTKKMSEDLTNYLAEHGFKVAYIHSDIETIERVEILRDLRMGVYDVLVGINLLREGIDLPEVSLVCILDADKEGFLRSRRSLIQTIGRAARNAAGEVVLYADRVSTAMQEAMQETQRRRNIQAEYNAIHHITPKTIQKQVHNILERRLEKNEQEAELSGENHVHARIQTIYEQYPAETHKNELTQALRTLMFEYAEQLLFEEALMVRHELDYLSDGGPRPNAPQKKPAPRKKRR